FFEPYHIRTDRVPGEPNLNKDGLPRAYDGFLEAKTHLFVRGNEANPDTSKALEPAVPAALGGRSLEIRPITLPLTAYRRDKRDFVIAQVLEESAAGFSRTKEDLAAVRHNATRAAVQALSSHPLRAVVTVTAVQPTWRQLAVAELEVRLCQVRHDALAATIW